MFRNTRWLFSHFLCGSKFHTLPRPKCFNSKFNDIPAMDPTTGRKILDWRFCNLQPHEKYLVCWVVHDSRKRNAIFRLF